MRRAAVKKMQPVNDGQHSFVFFRKLNFARRQIQLKIRFLSAVRKGKIKLGGGPSGFPADVPTHESQLSLHRVGQYFISSGRVQLDRCVPGMGDPIGIPHF